MSLIKLSNCQTPHINVFHPNKIVPTIKNDNQQVSLQSSGLHKKPKAGPLSLPPPQLTPLQDHSPPLPVQKRLVIRVIDIRIIPIGVGLRDLGFGL